MNNFTHGPWEAAGFSIYTQNKVEHWLKPRDPARRAVAFCYARGSDVDDGEVTENVSATEESFANAQLIAAAPELLSALQAIIAPYEGLTAVSEETAAARSAIAKALGGGK